jgi:ribonuclease D
MIRSLSQSPSIAVDTESNSLFAYQERVCLIQFSIPEEDYLVDPLALNDLQALSPIFRNPEIEKVFHGAEYDLVCLTRDFDFACINLFDTRVAARTLGWKRSGLSNLLETIYGVEIDKRYQRSNWGKRPLPEEMLDYARLDTHYLIGLRDHLACELINSNRWEEAHELCQSMAINVSTPNGFDPEGFWRLDRSRDLTGRQMAVLRELYLFRDRQARKLDRPPFKVIGDPALLDIARTCPKNVEHLLQVHGVSARIARQHGKGILQAVRQGLEAPKPKRPRHKRTSEKVADRYDRLRNWRKTRAQARKVESDIILPRDTMEEIAQRGPNNLDELHEVMFPLDWRFQTYGDEILNLINKKT